MNPAIEAACSLYAKTTAQATKRKPTGRYASVGYWLMINVVLWLICVLLILGLH